MPVFWASWRAWDGTSLTGGLIVVLVQIGKHNQPVTFKAVTRFLTNISGMQSITPGKGK